MIWNYTDNCRLLAGELLIVKVVRKKHLWLSCSVSSEANDMKIMLELIDQIFPNSP